MLNPGEVIPSAFPHLVGHVVVVASEPEMAVCVHAETNIAVVQNLLTIGDRAVKEHPGRTMGLLSPIPNSTGAVALSLFGSKPKPTAVRAVLVDLAPKQRGWVLARGLEMSAIAGLRAVQMLTASVETPRKLGAAVQAVFGNLRSSHDDLLGVVVVRERSGVLSPARFRSLLPVAAALGLFLASNSEASLWQASSAAGARADVPPAVTVPVERIADDYGRDLAWVVGSHAADLYSTAWALRRGATEANPLGPDVESRLALKMASCATTGLSLWKLRRDGHGKTATVIRWLYVAGNGLLVANNIWQAKR